MSWIWHSLAYSTYYIRKPSAVPSTLGWKSMRHIRRARCSRARIDNVLTSHKAYESTHHTKKSKIFSGSNISFGAEPNTQANVGDLAFPGVLPVLNQEAVRCAIKFGLAVNAEIASRSVFARKNYFYPDLPKGYQISQYELPVVGKGSLTIQVGDQEKHKRNTRAHQIGRM